MKSFAELSESLKKDVTGLKKLKLAVLGDSATQFLVKAIKAYGIDIGWNFDIFESEYSQVERQISDAGSNLYSFRPDIVVIFLSAERLLSRYYVTENSKKTGFAAAAIDTISGLCRILLKNLECKIILHNFAEINDGVFGNYGNKTQMSFLYQVRRINLELMELAQRQENVFISDVASLCNTFGEGFCKDPRMYVNADMVFSLNFFPVLAKNICDIINAMTGRFNKCLILDLDNTLWGGVIGDDGIENIQIGDLGIGKAFFELQKWIKELKSRGIILAVCSKNNESVAREPFEKHPDMVLKLDDIAVFTANWDNKVNNILHIQKILNIGLDSMVFLDDSAFERNLVKTCLPQITVPDLPEDPAEYLPFLRSQNLFETISVIEEDSLRTVQYKNDSNRKIAQQEFISETEYLQSLNMTSTVCPFDSFSIPRVAQLTQRSNQFNLRTIRYTDAEIRAIAKNSNYITLAFTLADRFGDYGIISAIILNKRGESLFVDTWIMSCRVLNKGMECFVLNRIIENASLAGCKEIIGEYIPTARNSMVEYHYRNLGFFENNGLWTLDVENYFSRQTYIIEKSDI